MTDAPLWLHILSHHRAPRAVQWGAHAADRWHRRAHDAWLWEDGDRLYGIGLGGNGEPAFGWVEWTPHDEGDLSADLMSARVVLVRWLDSEVPIAPECAADLW